MRVRFIIPILQGRKLRCIMLPRKDICVLILEACEPVPKHSKRGVAYVIKDLGGVVIPEY